MLEDFAHEIQVNYVSTLLEPFHTLVRNVDSEDIANEKTRTNDLTLETNNKVSIEDDTNNIESEHDHIMVTQSGDPNQKQRDEEYQRYKNQRSRTPQQSLVQYFRSKPSIYIYIVVLAFTEVEELQNVPCSWVVILY